MADGVGTPIIVGTESPSQLEFINAPSHPFNRRRIIRSAKNPLDKCTVVSIFPKEIHADKETVDPGHFVIPSGTFDEPGVLAVGTSSWWKDIDINQPMQEIVVGSIQMANSIINDYCNAVLGSDMSSAMPGLFFVTGVKTAKEVKSDYKKKLTEVKDKQDNWYRVLVKMADILWARTNNNPIVIADEMKLAAESLGLKEKAWLRDFVLMEKVNCKACGSLKDPKYPVCQVCKAVDLSHPLAKEVRFQSIS